MKKQNLKSLKLTKRTISSITNKTVGGVNTRGCYTNQICSIPYDPSKPLEPIPVDPSLASVCFCLSQPC